MNVKNMYIKIKRLLYKDTMKRQERASPSGGPKLSQKISGPDNIGKLRDIPAGCYSVFQRSLPTSFLCRRGQTRHSESEFTHFASEDFIVIHSCARFMWRCVDTQCIKCRRFARLAVGSTVLYPRLHQTSSKIYMDLPSIYHRSLVNAQR